MSVLISDIHRTRSVNTYTLSNHKLKTNLVAAVMFKGSTAVAVCGRWHLCLTHLPFDPWHFVSVETAVTQIKAEQPGASLWPLKATPTVSTVEEGYKHSWCQSSTVSATRTRQWNHLLTSYCLWLFVGRLFKDKTSKKNKAKLNKPFVLRKNNLKVSLGLKGTSIYSNKCFMVASCRFYDQPSPCKQ